MASAPSGRGKPRRPLEARAIERCMFENGIDKTRPHFCWLTLSYAPRASLGASPASGPGLPPLSSVAGYGVKVRAL
jgi:hypothetical protein